MAVPAFDLARAYARIQPDLDRRWREICSRTAFVLGPAVKAFEEEFAAYLGAGGCVGVGNGTDALVVALRALGVKPGDEVIVPAFTFIATGEAVALAGGKPVFADVTDETLTIDPESVAARIGPRTVGVIGVHLYGRPFDVEAIGALCARHGLFLLEDAAQAHGAAVGGRKVGTFGDLAAWSFYPSKNLGCFGDGGAVTGNDLELLAKVRRVANHGQVARYQHRELGTNSRLDALQAAVLSARLPLLDGDNERRREIACRYLGALSGVGDLAFPVDPPGSHCVYHQFTLRTARRDELMQYLAAHGIGHAIHYPKPLHHETAFAADHPAGHPLPVAERAAREVLSLPMFAEMEGREAEEVGQVVLGFPQ